MKKFLALLLAAMMLMGCCCAFADTDVEDVDDVTDVTVDTNLAFTFTYPDGYTGMIDYDDTGVIVNTIYSDNSENPNFLIVIYPDDDDELENDITLNDLTEEQLAMVVDAFVEDWNNPTYTVQSTDAGTKVLVIEENDAEYDMAKLVTLYQGYYITVLVGHTDGSTVTADDVSVALSLLSGMEYVAGTVTTD